MKYITDFIVLSMDGITSSTSQRPIDPGPIETLVSIGVDTRKEITYRRMDRMLGSAYVNKLN